MTTTAIILFVLASFCLFIGVIVANYEHRLTRSPIIEVSVDDCEQIETNYFGKRKTAYAVRYAFNDLLNRPQTLTMEEKFEIPVGEKSKKILIGENIDEFSLCELNEIGVNRSRLFKGASLFLVVLGIFLINPNWIYSIFNWIMTVETNILNDVFAFIVFFLGCFLSLYGTGKLFLFNRLKKKALTYCDGNSKSKATILEIYRGETTHMYILKTKNKKYYTEEKIKVFENKDEELVLEDRMDKSSFEFWIFMGIIISLASIALHFV